MNLFEYQEAEKKGLDSFTVMARAIREHFHDDEDKITPGMSRVMAKIIDDGFLDKAIEEQSNLIAHSKRIYERTEKQRREEEYRMHRVAAETEKLLNTRNRLIDEIAELQNLLEQETDPFLLGAKKAYKFMEAETHDKDKASKAFNSYLQGIGKWKQYTEGRMHGEQINME